MGESFIRWHIGFVILVTVALSILIAVNSHLNDKLNSLELRITKLERDLMVLFNTDFDNADLYELIQEDLSDETKCFE